MLIPVNQNIDEYKDDFYKGLTLRQSVISLVTVAVGVLVYLALTIAAYGFLKIHGMNIAEYLRKSSAVKERSSYSFIPQMLLYGTEEDDQTIKGETAGGAMVAEAAKEKTDGKARKAKILYLETEDSLRDLMEEHEEVMQVT